MDDSTELDNVYNDVYKNIDILSFTGTQEGLTDKQYKSLKWLMKRINPSVFVHGDCVGADAEAHDIAETLGCEIHIRPCTIRGKRAFKSGLLTHAPKPPLDRNHDIVDEGKALIACPKGMEEERRSGTWATVRYARKQERLIWIVYPDGTVDYPM